MDFQQYLDLKAFNASGAKLMMTSPKNFWDERINPNAPPGKTSKSMGLGSALHGLVLEGRENWHVAPDVNLRTKEGKAKRAAFEADLPDGAVILKPEEVDQVYYMAEAIDQDEDIQRVLSRDGDAFHVEENFAWMRDEPNVLCKARLDVVKKKGNVITVADLKTARDASLGGFMKSSADLRYHVQAAFYIEAAFALLGLERGIASANFWFICVENTRPYNTNLIKMDAWAIEQGQREVEWAIWQYAKYMDVDPSWPWPSYSAHAHDGETVMGLPGYMQDALYGEAAPKRQ